MARITMDIPDDFKNQMLKVSRATGASIRHQILNALRKEWEWSEEKMPIDGRLKGQQFVIQDTQFNGHSPRNVPLAPDGLPDFDAMLSPHDPPTRTEDMDAPATGGKDEF